jgi:RNA polymerase sigma-70 factor (ECF subfamily)
MEPKADPKDEELAGRSAAGDPDARGAFEALVHRYGGVLLGVVERQVGDHHLAHDLAQEIWIKVFRSIGRFRPEGSFRSWLFTIALNHVRDALRGQGRERVVFMDEFPTAPSAPGADPSGPTEERAAIEACLARVPEPFRSALTLVDVLELSYEEAAASLTCAVGTVKSRVNRGRFAFRDLYTRLGAESPGFKREPDLSGTTS